MRFVNLLLKGIVVGVANVVPGVSAGTFMVLLDIYDEFVEAIGNFLTNGGKRKDYFLFLLPLAGGAIGGILVFANLITFLTERYTAPTQFFFIGLVLGSVPAVLKIHQDMKPSAPRLAAFALGLGLVALLAVGERYGIRGHFPVGATSFLALSLFVVIGFLAGGAMVAPGMDGSYVFLLAGAYGPVMEALTSLTNPPIHWGVIVAVMAGSVAGIVSCSRLVNIALKRQPAIAFYAILGLIGGSFVGLWPTGLGVSVSSLVCVLTLVCGATSAYLLGKPVGSGSSVSRIERDGAR